jgi:hypothetical protein
MAEGSWRERAAAKLNRLLPSREAELASLEQEQALALGGTPIGQLEAHQAAQVCGTVRAVTMRPRSGVPALEAEIFDGTGSIVLFWLGRRRVLGVNPGRRIRAQGMVAVLDGQLAIYNPNYELIPGSHD